MQELDHLTNSYQQLKSAQVKFRGCVSDIAELTPSSKGQPDCPVYFQTENPELTLV